MSMRIIQTTLDHGRRELDTATGDELVRRIDLAADGRLPGGLLRESYRLDETDQKAYHAALVRYVAPGGIERFAVLICDPNKAEYSDSADRVTAEAAYEESVRNLAECAGTGDVWWEYTDVDGLPQRNDEDESGD